ncbi:hypothetical protein DMENIID0001_156770 [Sergentomyia squamirostris]
MPKPLKWMQRIRRRSHSAESRSPRKSMDQQTDEVFFVMVTEQVAGDGAQKLVSRRCLSTDQLFRVNHVDDYRQTGNQGSVVKKRLEVSQLPGLTHVASLEI